MRTGAVNSRVVARSAPISIVLSAALVVAIVQPAQARTGVAVGTDASPAATLTDSQWADSESSAATIAATYGHAVAVSTETTPTSEVSVLPNGLMQLQSDTMPVRAQQDGSWVALNMSLAAGSDGLLAPAIAADPVEFSDGGSNVMAKVQSSDGSWVSEIWPDGTLPTPTVSGATATYPGVFPGVDLALTATPAGMTEVLVVHSALSAVNPDLQNLQLGVTGATLTQNAVNSTIATTPSGGILQAEEPTWWDSSTAGSSVQGPGGMQEIQPLSHSVSSQDASLDVAAITADPQVSYPAYIDPSWSTGDNDHWYDDQAYPTQSYLNGEANSSWLGTGTGTGAPDGGNYVSRAFWQFGVSAMAGKDIISAQVSAVEQAANSSEANQVEMYVLENQVTPGATWNQENATANVWNTPQQTITPAVGTNGFNVQSGVAWAAARSAANVQFGLRSTNEGDVLTRKHWNLGATLTVTYDSKPAVPSGLAVAAPARGCGTAAAPVALDNAAQPVALKATESDPDGGTVTTTFTVKNRTTGAPVWSGAGSGASGAAVESKSAMPAGTLADRGEYTWSATTSDGTLTSAASATCYIDELSTPPAVPTLSATGDTGGTVSQGPPVGTGFAVTVTSPSTDVILGYAYWWQPDADTTPTIPAQLNTQITSAGPGVCPTSSGVVAFACPAAGSHSVTVTVAPVDTTSTLWVTALDPAGNVSGAMIGGTPEAAPLHVDVAYNAQGQDPNGVDLADGHIWRTSGLSGSGAAAVPDDATSDNLPVTVGSGLSVTDMSDDSVFPVTAGDDAFVLPGYTSLDREYDAATKDHAATTEGAQLSGYAFESVLGGLLSLASSPPSGTQELYSCTVSGDNETLLTATCGSGSGAALGYDWKTAPGGSQPSSQLYSCEVSSNAEHFDSLSTTCEGQTKVGSLGFVAPMSVDATTASGVDTTKPYTVSAWVYPQQPTSSASSTFRTILSEAGTVNSGFYLQEVPSTGSALGGVRFCVRTQTGTVVTACVSGPALSPNTWTMVTGVYDPANRQVRIIVGDGASSLLQYVAPYDPTTNTVSASGDIMVGSALSNSATVNQWDGQIVDPSVFQGVIDSGQLDQLYNLQDPQ